MDWTLLGLQPTKDKKAITAAYRARLTQVNPEDKPEEFKALRAAYEEALRLAAQTEETAARDESPVGLWMERVRALYSDYAARIRPENWKPLLADDVCTALDKRPQAEEALLRFFLEDYFVPQQVWQMLDSVFDWTGRRQELYEKYPREFVDYAVINGIRLPASLPYDLFTPGRNAADCDAYRRLYYRANQVAIDEMRPVLDQMAALSERHPYGEALELRLDLENGETEKARAGYRRLAETYPQDPVLTMGWAELCFRNSDWAETETLTRRVLTGQPGHARAKQLLAEALAARGCYDEAKDLFYELMRAAGGDQMKIHSLGERLKVWNEKLIQRREQTLTDHPEDDDNALELAWCYLQNDDPDAALRAALAADPNRADPYAYHNLHAKLRYSRGEYTIALEHLEKLEAVLRAMQPDGTEKTEKRLRHLPEILQLQGSCLSFLGRRQESLEKYEAALALAPDDPEILTNTSRVLYSEKNYARAVVLLKHLTELLPQGYHGFLLLAYNLYELRRDREAFDAVNRAQELQGGDLSVYVLKMRIMIRNGLWEQTHQTLDFLRQHGITNELPVAWCEAMLVELEEQDDEKALELYQNIAERLEIGDETLPWASQVYYRITVLTGNKLDARKAGDRQEMLDLLEKGLACDPDDPDCLDYKAWLLKRDGRKDEALELYRRLEAMPGHSLEVERALAELYYDDLEHNAAQALHYYDLLLERDEQADLHFYAGTCRRWMGDYAGAEKNFLREQELAPDDVDGFNGLAYVYEAQFRYEEALAQMEKAVELVRDRDRDYAWVYSHMAQVLRRLERPQQALAAVDTAILRYGYKTGYRMRFEICCQFGLWDKAKEMLAEWRKAKADPSGAAAAAVRLELYRGQTLKARMALAAGKGKLSQRDAEDLDLTLAELEGDWDRRAEIWKRRLEKNSDKTHALMNLAETCLWAGDAAASRDYAQQALTLLDAQLEKNLTNAALYASRRAMALALLGREQEARAALAAVRRMPLCASCDYGTCKDADEFEASMEEVFGNYERAMALHSTHKEHWPDELDFAAGVNRMKKKGL